MGAITTITLANGAATPVNKDFVPNKIDGDVAIYHEKSAGVAMGYSPLTISHRDPQPNGGSDVERSRFSISVPVLVTDANGVQTVSHTNRANIEFICSQKSTAAEREDILAFASNLLLHEVADDVVIGGNNIY
jgi:hypothetical protein